MGKIFCLIMRNKNICDVKSQMKVGEKNCGNNIPKKSPINVLQTES